MVFEGLLLSPLLRPSVSAFLLLFLLSGLLPDSPVPLPFLLCHGSTEKFRGSEASKSCGPTMTEERRAKEGEVEKTGRTGPDQANRQGTGYGVVGQGPAGGGGGHAGSIPLDGWWAKWACKLGVLLVGSGQWAMSSEQ